jgi:hypothetical protein
MNLRMAMQKYASGGGVKKAENTQKINAGLGDYSSYSAKQNHEYVNIPGVGDNILMFWDHPNKRVVVSDEGYWNKDSPVGEKLTKAVDWAHAQGYQAGVVVSPYSSDRFGDGVKTTAGGQERKIPGATDQQLRDYIDAADFVVTDPYMVSQATATPEMQNNFANFTKNVGDYANQKGKDSWLFLQGFGTKDVDPKTVEDYNNRLVTENAGRYKDMSFFNLSDFGFAPGESVETFGDTLYQLNTQGAVNTAAQAAQPFKMAEKIGVDLPTDWSNRGSKNKIDWLNQHNVDPNALDQAGVAQSDIDWMTQHGYAGNTVGMPGFQGTGQPIQKSSSDPVIYGGPANLGNDSPMGPYTRTPTGYDDPTVEAVASPYANNGPIQKSDSGNTVYGGPANLGNDSPMGPDYSGAYAALGGADTVNNLRNQFLGMGLDENTIGSIFAQYNAPQQPAQQMARGGMAHSNIEQYLTSLGMVKK